MNVLTLIFYNPQVCEEGFGKPCPRYHYGSCNETSCINCTQCEPGYACRGGVRYECDVGTYSDGFVGK